MRSVTSARPRRWEPTGLSRLCPFEYYPSAADVSERSGSRSATDSIAEPYGIRVHPPVGTRFSAAFACRRFRRGWRHLRCPTLPPVQPQLPQAGLRPPERLNPEQSQALVREGGSRRTRPQLLFACAILLSFVETHENDASGGATQHMPRKGASPHALLIEGLPAHVKAR
jgi:hypothetical protein